MDLVFFNNFISSLFKVEIRKFSLIETPSFCFMSLREMLIAFFLGKYLFFLVLISETSASKISFVKTITSLRASS